METLKQKLTELLKIDEGCELKVYIDSVGEPTIGIGRCLTTKGLSKDECDFLKLGTYDKNAVIAKLEVRGITLNEAEYLLSNDIDYFTSELSKSLSFFNKLPEIAKIVLLNMCFNLGVNGLLKFKNTLSFIEKGQYIAASKEMLNSNWKNQVGQRAYRLSKMLESCQ